MSFLFKNFIIKPAHVSWISFILLGLIVVGVGLFGTAYMINYLHEQLILHEANHNQNIATELISKFDASFENDLKDPESRISHTFEDYKAFGFRIFIVDLVNQTIVVDSESGFKDPVPIKKSWLVSPINLLNLGNIKLTKEGSAYWVDGNDHPMLIWLQQIDIGQSNRWGLGVAKDQEAVASFMDELHLHMDVTMMLIFALITLLGYFSLRSISRLYERRIEVQLIERTKELDAAHKEMIHKSRLAAIGQTASVLTHEMRNPLASIKLALSGLTGSSNLTERENRRVDMVLGEVDRLDLLLTETLDYVRPVQRSDSPIDLDLLLNQVLIQEEPILNEKKIKLKHKHCNECTDLCVDQAQMHQVFLNLIKNAIEACPKGGRIETSLQREDDQLIFHITNDCEPLTEEVLQNAFDPFFTTKIKGTGLGLGLVKRVVDEHSGSVIIESDSTIGAKVTIKLPIQSKHKE